MLSKLSYSMEYVEQNYESFIRAGFDWSKPDLYCFLFFVFQKFASDGLRTLVLGIKDLSQRDFDEWKKAQHEAAVALDGREEKLDAVYNQIEQDLVLLGATAIEDKLQVSLSK